MFLKVNCTHHIIILSFVLQNCDELMFGPLAQLFFDECPLGPSARDALLCGGK